MSVCADANITGIFSIFWTHKVHYKLQQSRLQNFVDGGVLSGWPFVRTPFVEAWIEAGRLFHTAGPA